MSSIQGGSLLSSLRQTSPISTMNQGKQVEKSQSPHQIDAEVLTDKQPIVKEELAQDRYDASLSQADSGSVETMNAQSENIAANAVSPHDLDKIEAPERVEIEKNDIVVETPEVGQDPGSAEIVRSINSAAPQQTTVNLEQTETVAGKTSENVRESMFSRQADSVKKEALQEVASTPVSRIAEENQTEALRSDATKEVDMHDKTETYYEAPQYRQGSLEITKNREATEPIRPEPEQPAHTDPQEQMEQRNTAEELATTVETNRRTPTVEAPSVEEARVAQDYQKEVQQKLEVKTQQQSAELVGTVEVKEPIVDQKVESVVEAAEAVVTPQPKVENDANSDNVGEAVADLAQSEAKNNQNSQETASQVQEPVETVSQVQEPVETVSQVQEPVETVSQVQEPVETASQVREPVEVASQVQEPVETASQVQEPVEVASQVQEPVETVSQVQEPVETASQVQEPVEVPPAADYFPDITGSGSDVELPEIFQNETGSASDYFAELPGSGDVDVEAFTTSEDTIPEDALEFLPDGTTALSQEELAYMQTDSSHQAYLDSVFGTGDEETVILGIDGEEYDPFEVLSEPWVNDSMNFRAMGSDYTGITVGEGVDLTRFEKEQETEEATSSLAPETFTYDPQMLTRQVEHASVAAPAELFDSFS